MESVVVVVVEDDDDENENDETEVDGAITTTITTNNTDHHPSSTTTHTSTINHDVVVSSITTMDTTNRIHPSQSTTSMSLPTTTTTTTTPTTTTATATKTTTNNNNNNNNNSNSNTIQMISQESIQRIVSGQAIYDLASCIKELIDNSIDANSTTINIRLYNKGIDIIEVSDDGIGIEKESHPYIALPHATSKIIHFSDIYNNSNQINTYYKYHPSQDDTTTNIQPQTSSVNDSPPLQQQQQQQRTTFGFRGEALHCIANLSEKLMIATRTSTDKMATKMEFHVDGTMNPSTITTIPRKIGTTVAVLKLFYNLPVRYKDYTLHIKEQRTKLVQLIIGYAIFLSPTIRFHIMDINSKNGKEKSLFITPYYPPSSTHRVTLKDSVSSILGCNTLHHLTDITIDLSPYVQQAARIASNYETADATNHTNTTTTTNHQWTMKGLISTGQKNTIVQPPKNADPITTSTTTNKPVHYFAINQRPVDLPVVSRLINKVYRAMSRTGSHISSSATTACTCIIEFTLPLHVYDINLSPDKRKVQFWNDDVLYNLIERALTEFWSTVNNQNSDTAASMNQEGVVTAESVPIPTLLPQQQFQPAQTARRNTSFSCGKVSLVTASSQTSSNINNQNNYNVNIHYPDDDDSIEAFENLDSPSTTARRVSSAKTRDDVSMLNSSFHSAYSNDSFTSSMNRSYHRRYAFVHNPQQSIQKQQEYGYDQYVDTQNVLNTEKGELPTNNNDSMASNMEYDIDQKPQSSAAGIRTDADPVGASVSTMDWSSSMQAEEQMIETESTSNLATSVARPSETTKERKQFQEIQQRFRRSDSHDSTSLLQLASISTSDNDQIGRGQNHDRSVVPPRKSSSLLDRFGYKGKATDTTSDVATTVDRNLKSKTQQQNDSKRPRTTADSEQQHRTVAKNRKPTEVEKQVVETSKAVSKGNEEPAERTASTALWQGVSSEDVVMASVQDRIAMIHRKRQRHDPNTLSSRGSNGTTDDASTTVPNVPISTRTNDPSQNDQINHDSNHSLTKADLQHMKVIGQLNLGFIIAMSPDNNVWILDQHACDERYQFETLQKQTTKLFEQPLIAPLPLELSYMEEACIVDNIKLFEQNGFRLQYDETKPSRHRFSLLAVPHSGAPDGRNAVQYGKQDVQDICAILLGRNHRSHEDDVDGMSSYNVHGGTGTDGSGLYGNNAVRRYAGSSMLTQTQSSTVDDHIADGSQKERNEHATAEQIIARLPKTIAMFASRACRNSIMIGKALSTKEMEKVIQHLSQVDTPWMCAHGRPTICHVPPQHVDVASMVQMDDRYASEHIAGPTITCSTQQDDTYEEEDEQE